jgi:hypothetical protein
VDQPRRFAQAIEPVDDRDALLPKLLCGDAGVRRIHDRVVTSARQADGQIANVPFASQPPRQAEESEQDPHRMRTAA